jgi:hypothetical protein
VFLVSLPVTLLIVDLVFAALSWSPSGVADAFHAPRGPATYPVAGAVRIRLPFDRSMLEGQ